jgi:hypothetical protein
MIKSPGNKVKFTENYTLAIADVLIVYSMLSPTILIIGAEIKLVPNFFRTLIVLLGPGLLAGAIYFRILGIQSLKRSKYEEIFRETVQGVPQAPGCRSERDAATGEHSQEIEFLCLDRGRY